MLPPPIPQSVSIPSEIVRRGKTPPPAASKDTTLHARTCKWQSTAPSTTPSTIWAEMNREPARQKEWWTVLWMAPLIAICTFVHGVWYLWMLPVAAFFLAGQFRWGLTLIAGWVAGAFLGASLTGHPFDSIYQALVMAYRAFGMHTTQRTLVTEFQSSSGDVLALILLGGLLILRQLFS